MGMKGNVQKLISMFERLKNEESVSFTNKIIDLKERNRTKLDESISDIKFEGKNNSSISENGHTEFKNRVKKVEEQFKKKTRINFTTFSLEDTNNSENKQEISYNKVEKNEDSTADDKTINLNNSENKQEISYNKIEKNEDSNVNHEIIINSLTSISLCNEEQTNIENKTENEIKTSQNSNKEIDGKEINVSKSSNFKPYSGGKKKRISKKK